MAHLTAIKQLIMFIFIHSKFPINIEWMNKKKPMEVNGGHKV